MQKGVLFITVGTSALTARKLGEGIGTFASGASSGEKLRQDIARYLSSQSKALDESDLFKRIVQAHQVVWKGTQPKTGHLIPDGLSIGDQIDRTSAEMTSTYFLRMTNAVSEGFLGRNWRVILLASSTPEGQFAAHVNACLLHDFLLPSPCNCTCDLSETCKKNRVEVKIVPGLDAKNFNGNTSQNLLDLLDINRAEQVICNITGGFKGTIPIISVWASRHGYPLFYQHEKARECVRIAFDAKSRLVEEKRYPISAFPTPDSLG
jgi:putative CRISPR-associated protein (TIGR02619 family)